MKYFAFLLGILCIGIAGALYLYEQEHSIDEKQIEEEKVEAFLAHEFEISHEDTNIYDENLYVAVIEIPKIQIKRGLFYKNNPQNHVDKNIQILNESDFPDIVNGTMLLAGHSGIGDATYFNHLHQLTLKDKIYLYYRGIQYEYEVYKIQVVDKTGALNITKGKTTDLLLITCFSTHQQLLIRAYQTRQTYM